MSTWRRRHACASSAHATHPDDLPPLPTCRYLKLVSALLSNCSELAWISATRSSVSTTCKEQEERQEHWTGCEAGSGQRQTPAGLVMRWQQKTRRMNSMQ